MVHLTHSEDHPNYSEEIQKKPSSEGKRKKVSFKRKRKKAVAIVSLIPSATSTPKLTINGRAGEAYLQYNPTLLALLFRPLRIAQKELAGVDGNVHKLNCDINATVHGGGLKGQADAIAAATAKAVAAQLSSIETQEEVAATSKLLRRTFRSLGFLTSDPRRKERKKYGLKKARKAPQFSKR